MRVLIIVLLTALTGLVLVAGAPGRDRPGSGDRATNDFEEVVFIDYGEPFHGGPPPHTATDAATDFRLTQGGISWTANASNYALSTSGCTDDCTGAATEVAAGFQEWNTVTGITFDSPAAGGDANPCGGNNAVSWASIDGPGDILAVASVCRNVATKVIVGFTITFDADETWSDSGDSGKFDIQAVMTHEAGHVIGLGHVNPPRDGRLTMFPTIAMGDEGPGTLGCGDILGGVDLYDVGGDCDAIPGD